MSAALQGTAKGALAADATGFQHVVGGPLRGLTLACAAPLTILVDADGDAARVPATAFALRLLAGIERPGAGKVLALGGDPADRADLRRAIALLGDDVLLDRDSPLERAVSAVAAVRGVKELATEAAVRAWIEANAKDASSDERRRRLADVVADPERARLVLASLPERVVDPAERDRLLDVVRAALRRGARVVIATTRLEEVLSLAEGVDAIGAIVHAGTLLVAGPAHGLPWAVAASGGQTRLVRVGVRDDGDPDVPAPAAILAADLFADPEVAPSLVAVEPLGRDELRLHVRDPRLVGRAIAARAKAGVAITRLVIHGASAEEVAAAYGYARAQGARW
jgi:hypothetical protein